jgi:hypothetical protein
VERKWRNTLRKKLTLRGLFTKYSSWQAKQSIPHTTVALHGNCVKMCEDFAQKFGYKNTGTCITATHLLTLHLPGNFWPETTRLSFSTHPTRLTWPPETFLCFPPCWHSWGDQGRIAGGTENPRRTRLPGCEMGLLWVWRWPVGRKLVFDQMAAPVPEIMVTLYKSEK